MWLYRTWVVVLRVFPCKWCGCRDGRTRSSGMGSPPWARYAVELAPLEGDDKWTGFFDGFDGRV